MSLLDFLFRTREEALLRKRTLEKGRDETEKGILTAKIQ